MTGISHLTYDHTDGVAVITMNDGKVNAMSPAMLDDLHAAFDTAQADGAVTILTSTAKLFSAGFDLKIFGSGDVDASLNMLRLGATLAERILSFPLPVITACPGHAYPMGAFLMLAADLRFASEGDYGIGMNEVAISMTLPQFAIELARNRLTPAYFNRALMTGEMFAPDEAATAGFVDIVVPAKDLMKNAHSAAEGLKGIDFQAHHNSKLKARRPAREALRRAIETELASPEAFEASRNPD